MPQRELRLKTRIIGLLLLAAAVALSGCSAVRLGYANGAQLAWWWIDGYFDFSSEQSPAVKERIGRWFDWHRSTQLQPIAPLLAQAQQLVVADTTAERVCAWGEQTRQVLEPAMQRAIAEFADIVPTLGERQFLALQRKYGKAIEEMKDEYLQPDPAERRKETEKRALERFERLYGKLGEAQLRVVRAGLAASPFNPELWMAERQRRQADALQTLKRLAADKPDRDARIKALQGLVQRSETSPSPEYRAYQVKLGDYNCQFAAQLHNATTPAQRLRARETIEGWAEDLRALMATPAPG
jgi:Family of unknown function (DUF6279)